MTAIGTTDSAAPPAAISMDSVTLEVDDLARARDFYAAAFDLGSQLELRESHAPTNGFRGFTLSLIASQPATVDELVGSALDAGATAVKPLRKKFWGYGAVVQAPDGTIWKVATSSKKNSRPADRKIDELVVLLGVDDVRATKRFYVERGLKVDKSYGSKYAQFADGPVKLGLYGRRALAKDAGVPEEGTGSHRIAIAANAGAFTDPDGFVWETAA